MSKDFDVVMALNYYAPYVSGLTDAARMVAEEMASRGKRVVVVACQHDKSLPLEESINGVTVIRTKVIARIGKGLISPAFATTVIRLGRRAKVVNLHSPMIESGLIALGLGSVPVVVTYQCDIALLPGMFNRLQTIVMDASNALAFTKSSAIVPSSSDYANSSRIRKWMPVDKMRPIAPPTRLHPKGRPSFRRSTGPHIGFLGRLVEEKGLQYLVDGFRGVKDPDARLLIAGDYTKVAGGSVVEVVRRHMAGDSRIELLGFLADDQIADFYASLDYFALPSVNSFEAYGIVQIEAMRLGVAALASDMPGVREPVRSTGFGVIVPPRDPEAITRGLNQLISEPPDRVEGARRTSELYSMERSVRDYSALFDHVARADKDHE